MCLLSAYIFDWWVCNIWLIAQEKWLFCRKTNGTSKLDLSKRKPADYMELAYREAISKLKYLLAESYAPTGMSGMWVNRKKFINN